MIKVFKFILSAWLSNSLNGSDVLLFLEFIERVSILYFTFSEFIILLYTFLVISFVRYKEYMICWISFSKISDVLAGFTFAILIVIIQVLCYNLGIICLGFSILRLVWSETLATRAKSERCSFPWTDSYFGSDTIESKKCDNHVLCFVKFLSILYWTVLLSWFIFTTFYFIHIWFF